MMGWLFDRKEPRESSADEKFATAMRMASEVGVKARSIIAQIEPFAHERDPFAALVMARDRAVPFEAEQESRIFLGARRDE